MKINHSPKTDLEIIGVDILQIIAKKFPETFFVGGFVRDTLLDKIISDIDIATIALPEQISELLKAQFEIDDSAKSFGVIRLNKIVEVTTFRAETYTASRYPKVAFIESAEADSLRRDFTINSLYMSVDGEILDFHNGIADIGEGLIKFIGDPETRLQQDPLRLARAIRFALQLNFKLDLQTATAIRKNFSLIEKIKPQQLEQEIKKLSPA